MSRWFDRRALIFYFFALLVVVLLIPCPPHYRYVGVILSIAYGVLGSLSWLDHLARWRSGRK